MYVISHTQERKLVRQAEAYIPLAVIIINFKIQKIIFPIANTKNDIPNSLRSSYNLFHFIFLPI